MTAASRARRALLVALASLALLKVGALMVCGDHHCRALAFDSAVLTAVHTWRTPGLDLLFATLTWGGSMYVLMPLALLAAALDGRPRARWQRAFLPLALLGTWAVVHVTKLLVARPRPSLFEPLAALPADASFPSAHAAQITAFACAWLMRPGSNPRATAALGLGLAVMTVGVSRVYLQLHYPSDVLFAIAASAMWVAALRQAFDAVGERP